MTIDGTTYTMYVDPATKFPAKITSMIYNVNLGDVLMETTFGPYVPVQGHRLPSRMTTRIDKWVVSDITFSQQSLSGAFGDLAVPEAVTTAAPANPTANVTVEEVGSGVWYLAGQSHHSVLVEFADHLTLIEAPQNEVRTLAVIQKARELRPNKPLRYLVNTHHHFDHSGGIRAAVAEGLTIVTHEANRAFYEDVVARKHTIVQDALAKNPKPLAIETVGDRRVFRDASKTLELYAYLPAERLLIEADLYTPPAPNAPAPAGFPFAPNLAENIRRNGIGVTRLAPIHGFIVPFSNFQAALDRELLRERLATSD
jgi:glyoxylase-like metal-dependent hydrolase (beta-lactamase superfamily II)